MPGTTFPSQGAHRAGCRSRVSSFLYNPKGKEPPLPPIDIEFFPFLSSPYPASAYHSAPLGPVRDAKKSPLSIYGNLTNVDRTSEMQAFLRPHSVAATLADPLLQRHSPIDFSQQHTQRWAMDQPVKNWGNFTGRMTASFSASLAFSKPATSSHCNPPQAHRHQEKMHVFRFRVMLRQVFYHNRPSGCQNRMITTLAAQ